MRSCLVTAAAVTCLVFVPPLFSQMTAVVSSSTSVIDANAATITLSLDMSRDSLQPVVTGAPYSGRQTTKSIQTLADGTTLTRQIEMNMTYRDSAGRVRTEWPAFQALVRDDPMSDVILVEIFDVATGYFLDPVNHVAHRAAYQPRQVRSAGALAAANPVTPSEHKMPDGRMVKSESLGTQIISGVIAVGLKNVNIFPAGSRMGNDRMVTTVNESWTAPQLGVTLLSTSKYLDMESTTKWEDFSTSEPDPALFQIPAGYQIVDETGPFKVVIRRQK